MVELYTQTIEEIHRLAEEVEVYVPYKYQYMYRDKYDEASALSALKDDYSTMRVKIQTLVGVA